jgi:hypothetical protein
MQNENYYDKCQSVTESTNERFEQIDPLVKNEDVVNFIHATEVIQEQLLAANVPAEDIYSYLLAILLHQC